MNFKDLSARLLLLALLGGGSLLGQSISSLNPPLGATNDQVIINGSGFFLGGNGANITNVEVWFNGALASTNKVNGQVQTFVNADNQITTHVPMAATSGYVTVRLNKGSTVQSPQQFLVIGSGPYATNFSNSSGGVTGAGGTAVTVKGVHFTSVTNVSFNGKMGTSFTKTVVDQVTITAPSGVTSGPLLLLCSNAANNFSTSNNIFGATNFFAPPVITGFAPSSGRANTNIIINGTNFLGASSVTFNGASATFTVINNYSIQATAPAGVSTGPVQIQVPYGSQTSTNFRVLPTISGFSPGSGPAGTTVTLAGANLNEVAAAAKPTVSFNGTAATVSSFSASSITCTAPSGASGTITVTTTNGSDTSSQIYYFPATLSSIAPTNGLTGTLVKITGANLTNASAVYFNGAAASFTVTNNNAIGATAPAGVTSGPIVVVTPAGGATNNALIFYAPPTISSFLPTHGLPGTNVTITGSSFTNATAVQFNGLNAASFTVVNNSTITAVVPNSAQTGPITVAAPGGTNASASNFTIDNTDLAITITDSPDPVFVGSNLVYTIVVTNAGPSAATNVKVTNSLPANVALKSAGASQGTVITNAITVYGLLGTINSGAKATVTITLSSTNVGTLTDTAWVVNDLIDSNMANNTNSITTTVWPLPLLSIQNLGTNTMKISWPAPLSNFTLQYKTVLTTNVLWTNLTNGRTLTSSNIFVTDTNTGNRFYRLTN